MASQVMFAETPHRRFNPLMGTHVLVSPQRALRPWLGQVEGAEQVALPQHDPNCYLCPGNARVGGVYNPDYKGVFVFENDFPALLQNTAQVENKVSSNSSLFEIQSVSGTTRVMCFSPDHRATLPKLSEQAMCAVVDHWCAQTAELGALYPWVQIFENKGAMMGCSNPHPHGQIWATDFMPDEAAIEDARQRDYYATHGSVMLLDVAHHEINAQERVVVINDDWVAVVPFWARWPFETLVLPRFSVSRLPMLNEDQRKTLAHIIQALTRAYDALFGISFPYSMGWHGAPFDARDPSPWQLHAHFYPPLLRSATVRKFMVGYEMLAEAQRDLTPEQAAQRLRDSVRVGEE
jgi:UDPglucose--hexose-1-phosphate uridylyltransferase